MEYKYIILAAAKAAKISGVLLLSICMHESNLTNALVANDRGSGSYGICQVKAGTSSMLGFSKSKKDLMNPKINAKVAAHYVKYQEKRYGDSWVKIVASYNTGTFMPSKGNPSCPKNMRYLKSVQSHLPVDLQWKLECGIEQDDNVAMSGSK